MDHSIFNQLMNTFALNCTNEKHHKGRGAYLFYIHNIQVDLCNFDWTFEDTTFKINKALAYKSTISNCEITPFSFGSACLAMCVLYSYFKTLVPEG